MYDKIVALGRFPSEVLTRLEIRHFMLPHPSGLNRQINDRKYIDARLDACVEYLDA